MPVSLKFDPHVTMPQVAIIQDATPTNDGVMTKAQAAQLAALVAGSAGAGDIYALYANGAGQHVNHRTFWAPEGQLLINLMQWEAWYYGNPQDPSAYIVSDGYGGAHALLWSGTSGSINFVDGGSVEHIVSYTSPDTPPPGVFSHFMVRLQSDPFANLFILTFINGILSGKILVPAGYTRSCVQGASGQGNLYVMGSDHSNAIGWMAMLRGWDTTCGGDGGVELGTAFIPDRIFNNLNQLYGPIASNLPVPVDFLCSYLQPPGTVVFPDLSYGYDTNGGFPARTQHAGYAAGGNDTYPDSKLVYPLPSPLVIPSPRTTAPFYYDFQNVPPNRGYTPVSPPAGAKRYDSFSRPDQTYSHVLVPTLGSTESGSLGPAVWQAQNALGGPTVLPAAAQLFNRSARAGDQSPSIIWIPQASDSADMKVTVDRIDPLAGCDGLTTVAARVSDDGTTCFYAFYQYIVGAQSIVYLYRLDGFNTFTLVTQASVAHTGWMTLGLECIGTTINVYIDNTQIISTTDSHYETNKGAGALFPSNPTSTGFAVRNWTVY